MGIGAVAEPLAVVILLFGGTWINRNKNYTLSHRKQHYYTEKLLDEDELGSPASIGSPTITDGLLENGSFPCSPSRHEPTWRKRQVGYGKLKASLVSPNTRVFKNHFCSRLLLKFPFLVEAWYWALIYWVSRVHGAELRLFTNTYLGLPARPCIHSGEPSRRYRR